MDANETLVKGRFDTAVAGISPDVVSLVGGGVAAGRGIRRRRRLAGAGGVAAASALIVGVFTTTGGVDHLFGSKDSGPADGTVAQLEQATPRGFAAAVMSHTGDVGTLIAVGGYPMDDGPTTDASMKGALMLELAYRTSGGVKTDLQVFASPQTDKLPKGGLCSDTGQGDTCTEDTLPDGTTRAVIESTVDVGGVADNSATPSSLAHYLVVGIVRSDQFVVAIETVSDSAATPLSVDELQAIATDPVVGLQTTADLNAQGEDIPDFIADPAQLGGGSGSASSSSSGSGRASAPSVPSAQASTAPPSVVEPTVQDNSSASTTPPN